MQQAIFIDRDGTINKDYGYSPKLELYDDIPLFFERVKKLDIPVIMITNQSGIAKKKTTHREVQKFNDWLSIMVGYPMKAYYCPHDRMDRCACRKPQPGLIYKAAIENRIDIGGSFFVGDSATDIETARNAGMFNYLVNREKNFSPSMSAYLTAVNIPIYSLEEIIEKIEELVYMYRNPGKHCRITDYKDLG